VLGELGDDLLAEEELKEPGLGNVGSEFDVIEAAFAKRIDHERLVVFEDDEVHGSTPGGTGFGHGYGQLAKFGFAQLDAGGVKVIDEFEQLPLPANELGAGLSATAIVVRHVLQRLDMLGLGRDVP
jgi:hypothetical protein